MSNLICPICQRVCKNVRGLQTHIERAHGTDEQKSKYRNGWNSSIKCSCLICKKEIPKEHLTNHIKSHLNKKTYICLQCGKEHNKNQKFCSHSCAAKYSNANRKPLEKGKTKKVICNICNSNHIISNRASNQFICNDCKHKEKSKNKELYKEIICLNCGNIFVALKSSRTKYCNQCGQHKNKKEPKQIKIIPKILGDFSKICYCRCKHCKNQFIDKTQKQYCKEHREFSSNKRSFYKFNFNIFEYPDLFDLELLKEVGFYGPGGKSGRWNKSGLSRDHIISISDAIKFNYDPYYISHPMNCNLIPWEENNKKKTKSSMTYEELIDKVIKFDSCGTPRVRS